MIDAAPPAKAETLTLDDCLPADGVWALDRDNAVTNAMIEAARDVPRTAVINSSDAWLKAFSETLQIPVGRMFKAACLKLSMDLPKAKMEDDGAISIALAPFVIESSHHPSIIATCGAIIVPFKFDMELSLEVEGAELHVERGRVVGVSTGTSKGVVRISFLNSKPPVELGTPEFTLPGALRFDPPAQRSPASRPS